MPPNLTSTPSHPLLYLITDRQQFACSPAAETAGETQLELIAQAAQAGCQLIQIREKDLSARELIEFVRAAIARARPHGAKVLVNDRLDVALLTDADGVHLRAKSLPATEVRRMVVRPNFLVGVSTHALAEARAAAAAGAAFIVCGPVFPTPSKAAYGAPLGLARFAEICRAVNLPVLALGGITRENFALPLAHGAAGIAGISLFNNFLTLGSNTNIMLSSQLKPQD
jgi:thiamine-phosphate pyrophosphorylase